MINGNIFNDILNKTANLYNPIFIVDFDHTITTFDSDTSIGIFNNLLGENYRRIKERIDLKVLNTKSELKIYLLWFLKIFMLKIFFANNYLEKAALNFTIRKDFIYFFNYCEKNNFEVIICSSGYKPLINLILNNNNIKNVKVVANDNLLHIVTPYNKGKNFKHINKNVILIGDSDTDICMHKRPLITFAICNNLYDYNVLNNIFNYVLIDNIIIEKSFFTSKTKVGICKYNNFKYFFKQENNIILNETKNYNLINNLYNVSKFAILIDKYIIYEYISEFEEMTINDYLYGNCRFVFLNKMFEQYNKSITKTLKLLKEEDCELNHFFKGRIYILKNNLRNIEFDCIVINNKEYKVKNILINIIKNIQKDKKLYSFLSQGDLTDTNMTVFGHLTDFESAGYNHVIGEISIFFVSLFSHGRYFYPKYNPAAYQVNKAVLGNYELHNIDIDYQVKDSIVWIKNADLNLPKKNKEILNYYLKIFLNSPFYYLFSSDFKWIKYYICMRLLTPISIDIMQQNDKITILYLIVIIYSQVNNLNDLLKIIND